MKSFIFLLLVGYAFSNILPNTEELLEEWNSWKIKHGNYQ